MIVRRIVANLEAADPAEAARFYRDVLGLDVLMDLGWIVTCGNDEPMQVQMSVMSEGGSATPVPDLSIEVDDLEEVLARLETAGIPLVYGPVDEPWGVRRVFVRDPLGRLLNILVHRD